MSSQIRPLVYPSQYRDQTSEQTEFNLRVLQYPAAGAPRYAAGPMTDPPPVIRPALPAERDALEALQLRASLIWDEYRADLEASPGAIALSPFAIDEQRVRVATVDGELAGFSEWSASSAEEWELEGLFVEPARMRGGLGTLLVDDLAGLAGERGIRSIAVVGNPNALVFYERAGFVQEGTVRTRFGPGIRMRLTLG